VRLVNIDTIRKKLTQLLNMLGSAEALADTLTTQIDDASIRELVDEVVERIIEAEECIQAAIWILSGER